jgi:CheY-like chemotaxis protein
VVQAINGIQAIEVYDGHASEIEIVVLDFDLPGRDGFEVAKHIRNVNSHIPILLTSGYLEPELKENIAKLGNIYFLEKPYDPEELLDRILTLINEREQ